MTHQDHAAAGGDVTQMLSKQQQLLHQMLMRSATDKAFRQQLLTDPQAAFAAAGVELPANARIQFVENRHDVTLVLPDTVGEPIELEESELAQIGGASIISAIGEFLSLVDAPPPPVFGTGGGFGGGGSGGSW